MPVDRKVLAPCSPVSAASCC